MNWNRLAAVVLALLAIAAPHVAAAQDWPKGTVRLIIPFPPGGPTDTIGRVIAQKLSDIWAQSVIVEYKPGASTTIGTDFVAKALPDGMTFGMVNSSLVTNPFLRKSMPYQAKDLAMITQLVTIQSAIVARPDAPFNTLAEMIAYAKKNPGKLTYGTPGAGSNTHLAGELLKRDYGFDMLHVAYKGSAPAHTELMGGRIDLVMDPFLSVLPYVKAGRMKMLATLGPKRVPGYAYPSVSETIPGFSMQGFLGFVAPAGTPKPIVQKIQADTARVLADPEIRKRIEDYGMEVVVTRPEQFDAFTQSEMRRWARVIADAKIEVE